MPQLLVTFFHNRTRPGVFAVSPVSTNLVFLDPDDWESDRQEVINTDRVSAGFRNCDLVGGVSPSWLLHLRTNLTAPRRKAASAIMSGSKCSPMFRRAHGS